MLIEIPSMYYCNNTIHCPEAYGFGSCMNHLCVCDANFYQMYNATTGKTHCRLCSRKFNIFTKNPSLYILHITLYRLMSLSRQL